MHSSNHRRVIEDLCGLIGFKDHDILLKGGKLRIDDYLVSFIYNPHYDPANLLVYVDMGAPSGDREHAYETVLKINFELGIGNRGIISLHPKTQRLFYSFGYALDDTASGRALLDTLIRFVGDVALEAIDLSPNQRAAKDVARIPSRTVTTPRALPGRN
ncbi:hypothetical protein [Trinickia mobilis]|uniref:hypothetical protein n=1 Tax=Trinickia mobilis TaxID=2816356 RepID=UPI001A8DE81F|nr:hypothetical protein [Trinickia mobilis]